MYTFMRLSEVKQITGLSRSSIYLGIERGTFPRQIHLSARSVAWRSDEVMNWMVARVAASRPTGADSHYEVFQKTENRTGQQTSLKASSKKGAQS